MKKLVNLNTMADALSIHPRTALKLVQRGLIPGMRVGRVWRFDVEQVLAKCQEGIR